MPDDLSDTLLEASFAGVAFPVESEDGEFGHDVVENAAFLQDGAQLEPTGWRARHGTLNVALFNDVEPGLWPGRYRDLVDAIRRHPVGDLVHPVEGVLRALVKTGRRTTDPDARSGVRLRLDWVEDGVSDASLLLFAGSPPVDPPTAAERYAADADAAMLLVGGSYVPVAALIEAGLEFLETRVRTASEIDATLQSMMDPVEANIAAPAFATITGHAAVVALERLRAALLRLRTRYLPDQSRVREYVTPVTMADWQVALQVYGDARMATLVRAANALPDYLAIPPGVVLTILPGE